MFDSLVGKCGDDGRTAVVGEKTRVPSWSNGNLFSERGDSRPPAVRRPPFAIRHLPSAIRDPAWPVLRHAQPSKQVRKGKAGRSGKTTGAALTGDAPWPLTRMTRPCELPCRPGRKVTCLAWLTPSAYRCQHLFVRLVHPPAQASLSHSFPP